MLEERAWVFKLCNLLTVNEIKVLWFWMEFKLERKVQAYKLCQLRNINYARLTIHIEWDFERDRLEYDKMLFTMELPGVVVQLDRRGITVCSEGKCKDGVYLGGDWISRHIFDKMRQRVLAWRQMRRK